MSIDKLKTDLKNNIIRNVYLFYGPETYLLNYYVGEIKSKTLDPMTSQLNCTVFESANDISEIIAHCTTMPFFADRKLIILKNTGIMKAAKTAASKKKPTKKSDVEKSGAEKSNVSSDASDDASDDASGKAGGKASGVTNDLSSVIEHFPDFSCLLIIEDTVDKRLKIFKEITKHGLVVEFPFQATNTLDTWVQNVCSKEGKAFNRAALNMFMQKCEPSMTDIKNEINKLLLYTGTRKTITIDDICAVCTFPAKTRIFDLIDSIVTGKKLKARQELNDLLALKEPIQLIMIMISKHFISLRQLKSLANLNVSLNEATSIMSLNPYAAKIMWRQCVNFSISKLEEIVEECLNQDSAVKRGDVDSNTALDILIASI